MTGALLAQALGVLTSPIVTRLFAPEAYGISTIFSSVTTIITVIACLRYEPAIMLPKTHEEAANVLAVSLCSVLIITLFCTSIVIWGSGPILRVIRTPDLKNYLWLIPVAVFFSGAYLALNYWNTRTTHFGRLSVVQIISSITMQTFKLTAGFAGFVSGGVLIGTGILGGMVSLGALAWQIWQDDKRLFISCVRWQEIANGFVRFRRFPIIDTWGILLNSISWQLPALMLSSFFSLSIVGFYALALTVIQMPLGIVYGALAQVFYQKACEEKNVKGNNGRLVENLMDKLIFIGIMPTAVLAMVGEELFAIVFGARWSESGRYTQILVPWIFFWFISSPLSSLFSVYERQGAAFSVHSIIFLSRAISLYIGGIYQNVYLALGLFSVTGVASYALIAAWNIRLAGADGKRILFSFLKYSLHSLPILLSLFLVKYIFQLGAIVILSSALLIVIFYFFTFRSKYISIQTEMK